jgi:hypothetical protein
MKRWHRPTGWVVYESAIHVRGRRLAVVCEQTEWDVLPPDIRRNYILVKDGIATEGEAELVARVHLPPERDRPRRVA